ncbi:tyrosine--tRNA ligase [Leucobacter coleopterorum]|uniref:Tyrosine--tRNA ligase n=1 Tax=Leucobacter coleopterorum TaxID=2714933 RepID=A0ABX6JUS7_9MICO|nr:tyrosine--tRNA ligase [Leucobacter coleopterorum]
MAGVSVVNERTEILSAQKNDDSFATLWEELEWRGLIHVSTDAEALSNLLEGEPFTYYCGFDPTAPSLHLGNLVQLLLLRRLQLKGHKPLGLVGGSTGLIGDPRPTAERTLNSLDTVAEWVARLQAQVSKFLSQDGESAMRLVNNLDWTAPLSAIDFLREIGKHFRVGTMLKKDAVAARLNSEEGISYTEFSYQILQGFDFLELFRQYDCVLQSGGSDQWGNLTSGTDLIRKVEGASAHAIGTPLITNSDGTKFGKSEGNAIWLDAEMCSPYAFYQFWLNQADADVVDRLKVFTFMSRAEIEEYARQVAEEPFKRAAQKRLALEVTTLVHGAAATQGAIDASGALFGQGDLAALDAATLGAALSELPQAMGTAGASIAQLMVDAELVKSLGEARRAIKQGGVYVNNVAVTTEDQTLATEDLLYGEFAVLRRGKKTLAGVRA